MRRWAVWVAVAALFLLWEAGAFALASRAAAETPTPEIVVVTATPYRCANGDVLGSSTACPMAIINVGPTATADVYHTTALASDGREYAVYRGWSYGEVVIASALVFLAAVTTLSLILRGSRGG